MEQQPPEVTMKTPEKTPEEIEREMLHTRESITEKVAALEHQVVGTVQSATNAVAGTVEAVKSLVSGAPTAMKESVAALADTVREKFDVSGTIRNNPWAALGGSAAAGFLVGYLLGGRSPRHEVAAIVAQAAAPPPQPQRPREPGVFDELIGMVGTELKRLAKDAINTTSAALKQNISTGVPKLVDAAASRVQVPVGSGV